MVGRRRASPLKRVRVAVCDSKSLDPHCRGLTRGSPSPAAPHFRWAPPSPGLCKRHRRSPSPMPLYSPDPAEVNSSEEGEATAAAVSTSEDEDYANLEGGLLVSSNFFKTLSIPEESDRVEGSTSATSSDSSTISPTTAVLLCQDTIAAGGPVDGGLKLARANSVSSVSSPFVDGYHSVSDGVQQLVVAGDGGQGCAELLMDSVGCGGAQSNVMASEAVSPSVDADDVQCCGIHKVSSSSVVLSSFESAMDGGELKLDVQPLSIPLRQCDQVNVGSNLLGSKMLSGSNMLVGRNNLWAVSPLCESSFPFFGGSVGRVGDGLVSEEGRVSPVAREALRPQPADGLRQPPSSPVDPVIGAESGDLVSAEILLGSQVRLAPPSCLRRGDEVAGGREEWLTVYPDALKKATERVCARRLVRRLAMAKMKDGEFREKLGCRRSDWLSSPVFPVADAVGFGRSTDLKSIEEDVDSEGAQDLHGADLVDLIVDPVTLSGGPASQSVEGSDISGDLMRASSVMGDDSVECSVPIPVLPVFAEALTETEAQGGVGGSTADSSALAHCHVAGDTQVRMPCTQVKSTILEDNPIVLTDLELNASVVLGQGGGAVADSLLSTGLGVDGSMVCGQQGPVAEGVALRLSSTDGRQQQPLMLTVPSSPMTGVGHDPGGSGERDCLSDGVRGSVGGFACEGGGRSYASAVGPDRRSDVRLHFVPSGILDDGEE
ncbi:hypothetical protein Dimus_018310, partial [Dionaea muscipula]